MTAIGEPSEETAAEADGKRAWKYLRVLVEPGLGSESNDRVNIRVPFKLIRAGLKFAAFIPREYQGKVDEALREKGMNVDLAKITPQVSFRTGFSWVYPQSIARLNILFNRASSWLTVVLEIPASSLFARYFSI